MVRTGILFAGALLAVLWGLGSNARAEGAGKAEPARQGQPSAVELASARRLFAEAIVAEDHERWAEALEIYERVGRIVVSPSLQYHVGVCHEALGNLVEAVNAFELAAAAATERREAALAREARGHLAKVRAQVAQLTLTVPVDAEGVRIEIDGQAINPALAGTAVPINPGARRVVVRADNYRAVFDRVLRAAPGQAAELRADLGARTPRGGAALAPARARPEPTPAPAPAPAPAEAPSRAPAFVIGGTALALAAGAVATGVAALGVRERYLELNQAPTAGSRAERESLRDEGEALAITSTALTGGALIAGAFATFLFWPSSAPAGGRSARVSPWVGPGGAGLGIGGSL